MKTDEILYALSLIYKTVAGNPWILLEGIIPITSDSQVLRTSDSLIIRLKEE